MLFLTVHRAFVIGCGEGEILFLSYFCLFLKLTLHLVLKRTESHKLFCSSVPRLPLRERNEKEE